MKNSIQVQEFIKTFQKWRKWKICGWKVKYPENVGKDDMELTEDGNAVICFSLTVCPVVFMTTFSMLKVDFWLFNQSSL